MVRELIALKELIDVPPASVTSEFVQLTRADAEKVADLLNKLLEAKKDDQRQCHGAGQSFRRGLGNEAPMSNEHDLLSGPADNRGRSALQSHSSSSRGRSIFRFCGR